MICSEVQRTLVKSPPELWAELSDPAALARHLGQLGEIRITRTEPEARVEWETDGASGTVLIKPSGWGTKVTLSVTRVLGEPTLAPESRPDAGPATEAEPEPEPAATAESGPTAAAEPETTTACEPETTTTCEPETTATAEPEIEPRPRRGLFARLFGRRRRADVVQPKPSGDEPPDAFAAVRRALAPETLAAARPFAGDPTVRGASEATALERDTQAEQIGDISAELKAAEEVAADEVTAVLTAVLDRLGAAHHRPFSRA